MSKEQLPISPHLQIYKPQITSILSIAHRITGFSLNFLLILVLLWITALTHGEKTYDIFINFIFFFPVRVIVFFSILGFSYHMLNGIRHMFWDLGYFIENKSAAILGYLILIISLSLTFFLSVFLGLF